MLVFPRDWLHAESVTSLCWAETSLCNVTIYVYRYFFCMNNNVYKVSAALQWLNTQNVDVLFLQKERFEREKKEGPKETSKDVQQPILSKQCCPIVIYNCTPSIFFEACDKKFLQGAWSIIKSVKEWLLSPARWKNLTDLIFFLIFLPLPFSSHCIQYCQ